MKLAVFDLDGVLSTGEIFSKDTTRAILNGEKENLDRWKSFMTKKGVPCVAVTGRSLEITRELLGYMDALSVCEHGTMIVDPKTGREYHIAEGDDHFRNLTGAKNRLEEFIHHAGQHDEFLGAKFDGAELTRMRDNLHILTYEFNSPDGEAFARSLYSEVVKFMSPELRSDLDDGRLVAKTCDMALDIIPGVSKKDGLIHILGELGVATKDVIILGDSYHSDGEMMKGVPDGIWICPGNADKRLKRAVSSRGERGYVAEKPFFEGAMEGLEYFLGSSSPSQS
ncbi:HAD family phosphatase [Candidatus Woesearchaeota archaeon]|jgi:HAD superfamily hydrolase (TIGR01484 family)|nr:HAD family phosphatase [Candidatus Woesearchaeota archaeon]MBT6045176.1 HAD family phosphatase [Candidatus Woesearchaeota archaeon]